MDYQIVSNNRPLLLELKAENHDHCILKYLVISNKSAYLSQVHRYGSKKHKYLIPHVLLQLEPPLIVMCFFWFNQATLQDGPSPFKRKRVLTQDQMLVRSQRNKQLRGRFKRISAGPSDEHTLSTLPSFSSAVWQAPSCQEPRALIHSLVINTRRALD